ncbi:MAG: hypothetical protein Q6364_01235 [Candidatus Hermodarchaeota archaeon]|nr:hypothetical protein [Candidatus Hermodarchaeota archaeon]
MLTRKIDEGPDILGAVTFGLIIILLAIIFIIYPSFFAQLIAFVTDIVWQEVVPGFWWWVPATPANHIGFYTIIYQFTIGTLIISVIVLILRVIFGDTYRRQIESIGGIIMGAGIVWAAWNLLQPPYAWTVFTGYFIVFAGVSLIISSLGYWFVRARTSE